MSGVKYRGKLGPVYYSESKEFEKHYFNKQGKIYSDKLSKFVIKCNEHSSGKVFKRISKCFKNIFIDELQDLAGYDLDILDELISSDSNLYLVGDPRQGTFSTVNSPKFKKYQKSQIVAFFKDLKMDIEIDESSLNTNFRCVPGICDLANTLYPEYEPVDSGNENTTGHDGIYVVPSSLVNNYLERYSPMQLRDRKTTKVIDGYPTLNFGISKGREFDRVLIYPTGPMANWLVDTSSDLKPMSRAKLYVALTRAAQSVGIVVGDSELKKYNFRQYSV
jgi:superfamily I DNA/RNA helicase